MPRCQPRQVLSSPRAHDSRSFGERRGGYGRLRGRRAANDREHPNSVRSACDCSKLRKAEKSWRFSRHRHTVVGMITILSALVSLLSFRVRSRASLELELVALRHQVTVLRRQRPGRARLFCADRLLWVWLYQSLAADPQRHGAGQTSNRNPVASQGLPPLLAVAITPSGTAQDGHRDP